MHNTAVLVIPDIAMSHVKLIVAHQPFSESHADSLAKLRDSNSVVVYKLVLLLCWAVVVPDWRHRRIKMSDYFYITCKKNGKVLDCDSPNRPTLLTALVTRRRERRYDTQLWKWDCHGRLVNKAGNNLVADIKKKNKASGTPVILWSPTENSNQVWRVEGDVIKSGLNDLAISGRDFRVVMASEPIPEGGRWEFVPEQLWKEYEVVLEGKNPVKEAEFLRKVAEEYIKVITGYEIHEYEKAIPKAIGDIHECADELNKVAKNTGIARITGGAVGIAGGAAFFGGLILAPFTAGASLALTVGGVAAGVTGGLTTVGTGIAKTVLDKENARKLTNSSRPLLNATMCLHGFLCRYIEKLEAADKYLKTEEGKDFLEREGTHAKLKVINIVAAYAHALGGVKIGVTLGSVAPRAIVGLSGATKLAAAAGSVGARALSGSLAAIGMVIGVWDVVGGVWDMKDGEGAAIEFRKAAENLEKESGELIKLFKQLSTIGMKDSKELSTTTDKSISYRD